MIFELKVNAALKADSRHLGKIIEKLGRMKITKIIVISMTVILTALIFNLDKLESFVRVL